MNTSKLGRNMRWRKRRKHVQTMFKPFKSHEDTCVSRIPEPHAKRTTRWKPFIKKLRYHFLWNVIYSAFTCWISNKIIINETKLWEWKWQNSTVARAFSSRWARDPNAAIGIVEIFRVESLATESPTWRSFLATARIWLAYN